MLRPVWGQLELAAEGVRFLGLLEEGSATHSLCARFSAPPFFSLFPFSSPLGAFLFVFFKCLFVWVELARVGVSGYGPLHSDLEKAQGE